MTDLHVDAIGNVVGPAVILAYDGIAADEASVMIDILTAGGLEVLIASVRAKPVTSYNGRVVPTKRAGEIEAASAVLIPGGIGVRATSRNEGVLQAIATLASRSRWIGATSTGSVLLAAAGVIDGAQVTTHWLAADLITEQGLELVNEPYVEWGRVITASGVVGTATLSFRIVGAVFGTEAEQQVRDQFIPPPQVSDRRYIDDKHKPWWRTLFRSSGATGWSGRRKRITEEEPLWSTLDPNGLADVVVLDLFDTGVTHGTSATGDSDQQG